MKTVLIIIEIVSIIYYVLACLGLRIQANEELKDNKETNIFTKLACLILVITIGCIPVLNFILATAFLFDQIENRA